MANMIYEDRIAGINSVGIARVKVLFYFILFIYLFGDFMLYLCDYYYFQICYYFQWSYLEKPVEKQ